MIPAVPLLVAIALPQDDHGPRSFDELFPVRPLLYVGIDDVPGFLDDLKASPFFGLRLSGSGEPGDPRPSSRAVRDAVADVESRLKQGALRALERLGPLVDEETMEAVGVVPNSLCIAVTEFDVFAPFFTLMEKGRRSDLDSVRLLAEGFRMSAVMVADYGDDIGALERLWARSLSVAKERLEGDGLLRGDAEGHVSMEAGDRWLSARAGRSANDDPMELGALIRVDAARDGTLALLNVRHSGATVASVALGRHGTRLYLLWGIGEQSLQRLQTELIEGFDGVARYRLADNDAVARCRREIPDADVTLVWNFTRAAVPIFAGMLESSLMASSFRESAAERPRTGPAKWGEILFGNMAKSDAGRLVEFLEGFVHDSEHAARIDVGPRGAAVVVRAGWESNGWFGRTVAPLFRPTGRTLSGRVPPSAEASSFALDRKALLGGLVSLAAFGLRPGAYTEDVFPLGWFVKFVYLTAPLNREVRPVLAGLSRAAADLDARWGAEDDAGPVLTGELALVRVTRNAAAPPTWCLLVETGDARRALKDVASLAQRFGLFLGRLDVGRHGLVPAARDRAFVLWPDPRTPVGPAIAFLDGVVLVAASISDLSAALRAGVGRRHERTDDAGALSDDERWTLLRRGRASRDIQDLPVLGLLAVYHPILTVLPAARSLGVVNWPEDVLERHFGDATTDWRVAIERDGVTALWTMKTSE